MKINCKTGIDSIYVTDSQRTLCCAFENNSPKNHKNSLTREGTVIELTQPLPAETPTESCESSSNAISNAAIAGKLKKRVELSWKNVKVFSKNEDRSIIKQLCVCRGKRKCPQIKQILFDGKKRSQSSNIFNN